MANFQDIIEFLRINRRSEEANKNIILSDNVLLAPLEGDENYYVDRNIFENNFIIYKRLFSVLNSNNVNTIYVWENSSDKKYLFQKSNLEYINLLNGAPELPNPSELIEYSIETDNYSIYFYDVSENNIVIKYEDLPETILFPDIIPYNPLKDPLSYFNSNETLIYEYDDETSITYSALRSVLQNISSFKIPKALYNSYRFVDTIKDNENGTMHLIPKLYYYSLKSRYFLKYEFWKPTQQELGKIKKMRPFYEIPNENVALSLEFHSKGAFITFLNETIFSQSNFDFSRNYNGDRKQQFKQEFIDLIITPLEKSLFSPNLNYNDIFTTLYYLHESVTVNLSDRFIWFILEWAITRDDLTNFSIKEEDIFIKLIKLLLLKEGQEVKLMNWFLETKIDNDKKITKFEFIYNRIDGDNFMEFAKVISQVWKKSRFIYPDTEKNPEFATTDGLLFLPYSSQKALDFYFTSVSMSFETHSQKGRLLKTEYETGKTQKVTKAHPRGGTYQVDEEIIDEVWYHPFYPIYLKDIENQETEIKLDAIVPAFMLKANQDKQFWSNVITTAEYAADILTTLSGVGNIAKFRYLANFATKASRLRFVSEAGEAVANVRKVVAATAAVVEITSGTVNTLLKLTGARDAAWGKSLSEYLFWLELLSLSGELSVAIHNGLRKSAKEILEHEDDIRKSVKNADEAKEIDNVVDELMEIAELDMRQVDTFPGGSQFEILSSNLLKKIY